MNQSGLTKSHGPFKPDSRDQKQKKSRDSKHERFDTPLLALRMEGLGGDAGGL